MTTEDDEREKVIDADVLASRIKHYGPCPSHKGHDEGMSQFFFVLGAFCGGVVGILTAMILLQH